jgi:hypothetical protein
MPIINMAYSREEAEAKGVNVRSIKTQASKHVGTDENGRGIYEPSELEIWLYDTHVGLCLEDFERNGYDDSDFCMKVWNPETRCVETIEFASTRGWSYPCYGSKPDATPEVAAAANAREREMQLESFIAHDKASARRPKKDRVVRIVKGRTAARLRYEVVKGDDGKWRRKPEPAVAAKPDTIEP